MRAVVDGVEHDRVPFVQYSGLTAPDDDIWSAIGRDEMGILKWVSVHRADTPNCRFEMEDIVRDGKKGIRYTLVTPKGTLHSERLYEFTYNTTAAARHFVRELDDYQVLMAYLRDICISRDVSAYHDVLHDLGDDGIPHVYVLRTPYQQLWVEWVSIEDLAWHMAEYPDVMAEVIGLMTDVQRRIFEVVCDVAREEDLPYIDFPDNITAPMIGETYFRTYCVPAYNELAEMLDETGRSIPIYVHTDGDLKSLWTAIGESRVRGLDSMSPPPDNDTGVADAMALWPEMRVSPNFPSSVHLMAPEAVYRHAMQILEEGGRRGRLQIQISENVPPTVWRTTFPEIVRAIHNFGGAWQ